MWRSEIFFTLSGLELPLPLVVQPVDFRMFEFLLTGLLCGIPSTPAWPEMNGMDLSVREVL
jgi:hypothetical protein